MNEDLSLSSAGLALIQTCEGLRLKPYKCSAGKWTIGYGHTTVSKVLSEAKVQITEDQARKLLEYDLGDAERAVKRLVKVPLTQGQFDALVSFTFNLGEGRLGSSTLLAKLNGGDYAGAAEEFGRWTRAGEAVLPGLVKRRAAEKALFVKGVA
jgi:lysozyme